MALKHKHHALVCDIPMNGDKHMQIADITNIDLQRLTTSPTDTTQRMYKSQPGHTTVNGRHASNSASMTDAMINYIESYKNRVIERG